MRPTGHIEKIVPRLRPSGPATNYAREGCYLASTRDCSASLSNEHYVSKTICDQMSPRIRVGGAPWLGEGEQREIPVSRLVAKILCTRHNAALSPLDAEAGKFFAWVQEAFDDLNRKTLSRKKPIRLVSGEIMELWLLKVACGFFFSNNAAHQRRAINKDYSLDIQAVVDAIYSRKWGPGCGLYLQAGTATYHPAPHLEFAPIVDTALHRMIGFIAVIHGFRLQCFFDRGIEEPLTSGLNLVHRPSYLQVQAKSRQHIIVMTWPEGTPPAGVRARV